MADANGNPIHTHDDALLWCAAHRCTIDFHDESLVITHRPSEERVVRKRGQGGFDVRGNVMMGMRAMWELLNIKDEPEEPTEPT